MLSPKDSPRGRLLQRFVRARIVDMTGIDVGLYDFDPHASIFFFIVSPDEEIYLRYGGRDAVAADSYLDLASLELALELGLEQHAQNLEEALGLASGARRRDPNNPEYADTLGWIHYKMNNYTLAVDQLLFSVNNGQPKAGNYYRLGMAYYGKGDKILSKQTLRKAIELEESFPGREEAQNILREL